MSRRSTRRAEAEQRRSTPTRRAPRVAGELDLARRRLARGRLLPLLRALASPREQPARSSSARRACNATASRWTDAAPRIYFGRGRLRRLDSRALRRSRSRSAMRTSGIVFYSLPPRPRREPARLTRDDSCLQVPRERRAPTTNRAWCCARCSSTRHVSPDRECRRRRRLLPHAARTTLGRLARHRRGSTDVTAATPSPVESGRRRSTRSPHHPAPGPDERSTTCRHRRLPAQDRSDIAALLVLEQQTTDAQPAGARIAADTLSARQGPSGQRDARRIRHARLDAVASSTTSPATIARDPATRRRTVARAGLGAAT